MPEPIAPGAQGPKGRILVVDDEPAIAESLQLLLAADGHTVAVAGTARACLESLASQPADLVLLDLMLPDRSGLDALREIRKIEGGPPVVMLTAYGSIEKAVAATRAGAANFLTKPWNNSKLLLEVRQTLAHRLLELENARLRREIRSRTGPQRLVGESEAIRRVRRLIEQVAPSSATVLVSGESGTGKELVARAIHAQSRRSDKPFVVVNSGNIPAEMLESALFGHVRGAFPGAERDRQGCFAAADGGTLFLDEVGSLSSETQTKLVRAIQEREYVPVGSHKPVPVDVRIVAATHEDLQAAAAQGRFREDLYYRLNVIGIEVPPLRERLEDVPPLLDEFLTQICRRERNHFLDADGKTTLEFTPEARRILLAHGWPGNVRELLNVAERAVVLAIQSELGPELLPEPLVQAAVPSVRPALASRQRGPSQSLPAIVEDFERKVVLGELERHGYNQTETAKALQVALSTLNQKIQRLGIDVRRLRDQQRP